MNQCRTWRGNYRLHHHRKVLLNDFKWKIEMDAISKLNNNIFINHFSLLIVKEDINVKKSIELKLTPEPVKSSCC